MRCVAQLHEMVLANADRIIARHPLPWRLRAEFDARKTRPLTDLPRDHLIDRNAIHAVLDGRAGKNAPVSFTCPLPTLSIPLSTTMSSLNATNGSKIGYRAKSRPVPVTSQAFGNTPFGWKKVTNRRGGSFSAARALGVMISSHGKASVAPIPRRRMRRSIREVMAAWNEDESSQLA
jgi:hypothetical protein